MVNLAFDTSVIIEYLRTGKGLFSVIASSTQKINVSISTIVIFEIYRGHSTTSSKSQKIIQSIFSQANLIPVTPKIAKTAGMLDRDGYIKGNDALIAATCLEHNLTLVTLNTKHFRSIPKLKLY